ncbi:MAG: hypothetical protein QM796_04670 [Chthoniobacteraceae bacterium]
MAATTLNDRAATVLGDSLKANAFITGLSFQYDKRESHQQAHRVVSRQKAHAIGDGMQQGRNSWDDAKRLYSLIKHYLDEWSGQLFRLEHGA